MVRSITLRAIQLMGSRLSRNGLLSLAQAVTTILTYFAVMQQVVSVIGLEALGLWSLTTSLVAFVRMLDLGGIQVLAKLVATSAGNEEGQAQFVDSAAIASLVAFALVAIAAYYGLKPILLGSIEPTLHARAGWLLIGIVAVLPLNSLGLLHLGALDGIGRADIRALIAIASLIIYTGISLLLIEKYGVFALVYAQFVQHGFTFLVARGVVCHRVKPLAALPSKLSREKLREIISFGARLQVSVLPLALFDPLCRLLIGRSAGLELLGIYELAYKFAASTRQMVSAFANPIMPEFARLLVSQQRAAKKRYDNTQPMIVSVAMLGTIAQILVLPIASMVLIDEIEPVFILASSAFSFAWGVGCIGIVPQMYARAAGYLRYAIVGQWVLLALGAALVALASLLSDDRWILVAPAIAILAGYAISFVGEVRYFELNPVGNGAAYRVVGLVLALTLIASSAIALCVVALRASS